MSTSQPKDLRVRSKLKRERALKTVVKKQIEVYDYINPKAEEGGIELEDNETNFDIRQMTQSELRSQVDVGTKKKLFDFDLAGGPYTMRPTRNGRHLVIGSEGGEVSVIDRTTMKSMCEISAGEPVIDVSFLNNYTMFATAQRKNAYIYDTISGAEIHCLKELALVTHLEYLHDHFLLASWAENGILRYLDPSLGKVMSQTFTKLGPCRAFRHNPDTGIVHAGHGDGSVSLWTPSIKEPVMRIKAHYGGTTAIACHGESFIVTAGGDHKWKIWDLRRPDAPLSTHFYRGTTASTVDVSATGMIGLGHGVRVSAFSGDLFKTSKSGDPTYLEHRVPQGINNLRFCPFEDLLLMGKNSGIASMLVPGAGSSAFDSYGANPFETRNQRREAEVKAVIEKIRPDMITLPFAVKSIGGIADPEPVPTGPVKKVIGKKQIKRRQVTQDDVAAPPSKLDKLGVATPDGKYNPLNRFK
jgi:U3 small nucleolar RNA-associated protein 7